MSSKMQDRTRNVVENARKMHIAEQNSVLNVLRARHIDIRLKRKCITTQINVNKSYDKNVAKKMR
jgi:hypothetical protein